MTGPQWDDPWNLPWHNPWDDRHTRDLIQQQKRIAGGEPVPHASEGDTFAAIVALLRWFILAALGRR